MLFDGLKKPKDLTPYTLMAGVTDFGNAAQWDLFEGGYGQVIVISIPKFLEVLGKKYNDIQVLINNYIHILEHEFNYMNSKYISIDTLYSLSDMAFQQMYFYNMIFGTGTNFWLASRYVNCDSDYSRAIFGLRYVSSSNLSGNSLFRSNGSSNNNDYRLASVVSLGSGIQVKSGSGTESDKYIIGK